MIRKKYFKYNYHAKIPSYLESLAYDKLNSENITFYREYSIPGTSKKYDIFIPEYLLLIELDSKSFHNTTKQHKNDYLKDCLAVNGGYKIIRLNMNQLNSIYRFKDFLENI